PAAAEASAVGAAAGADSAAGAGVGSGAAAGAGAGASLTGAGAVGAGVSFLPQADSSRTEQARAIARVVFLYMKAFLSISGCKPLARDREDRATPGSDHALGMQTQCGSFSNIFIDVRQFKKKH